MQNHSSPLDAPEKPAPRSGFRPDHLVWQGKIGPAFWTIASVISLSINLVLLIALILLGRQLFTIKSLVQDQLIGGLHTNFEKMDAAHIVTKIRVKDTIQVVDTMPVVFDLPLKQNTDVVLTRDTPVQGATIFLNNQPVPLNLVLRKGTTLGIRLDMTVPVSQTIPVSLSVPVNLTVPVDIALDSTDLHEPFVGLQGVVSPYQGMLTSLPDSWEDTPVCGPAWLDWFCNWFLTP
jgi:hypothetical protein